MKNNYCEHSVNKRDGEFCSTCLPDICKHGRTINVWSKCVDCEADKQEIKFASYEPTIEIWIADNTCFRVNGSYNLWRRFWLWLLLGWTVTKIK